MDNFRQVLLEHSQYCTGCGTHMEVGCMARVDNQSGRTVCAACALGGPTSTTPAVGADTPIRSGTPGTSAQGEYNRRLKRHQAAVRKTLPIGIALVVLATIGAYIGVHIIAGLLNHSTTNALHGSSQKVFSPSSVNLIGTLLAIVAGLGVALRLWQRPQTTMSWAKGAQGERVVGARLEQAASKGVVVLHDRRIPGSKANIDHIAIGPAGIFVIDAKVTSGKPSARATGPIWNRGPSNLFVGGHNRTGFIAGMERQVAAVRRVLADVPLAAGLPIKPMVVLVGAEWGLFPQALTVQGVWVGWPKGTMKFTSRAGRLDRKAIRQIAQILASRLPEA